MTTRNSRGHREAWKLIHKTTLTNADIADVVGIPIGEVELLKAEYAQPGTKTGAWFTDQSKPAITG
jgi:hypothetical protein